MAIIWTNDALVYGPMYTSLGLDMLKDCLYSFVYEYQRFDIYQRSFE